MIDPGTVRNVSDLRPLLDRFWDVSAQSLDQLQQHADPGAGAPVYTVDGKYTSRGWTEWTQGFQFGSALLQFDATDEARFLESGRDATLAHMPVHLTHVGVHDHGFNNVSTYGNLWRLAREGRFETTPAELAGWELALKVSGAVQAVRWTDTTEGDGFIHSFNGPHSLFADTIRSLRSLALAHQLGHRLLGEHDEPIGLLDRLVRHARTTARYNVYYGTGRDLYDVRGRVAHESLFNTSDGHYRCASTQQGYSPFTTWTRGLAWIMLGYTELLEFLATLNDSELEPLGGQESITSMMLEAARASCDFYIDTTPTDGIPYWDTGAPGLSEMPGHRDGPADPDNPHEPVDSSAAAIACQGLLRLGQVLRPSEPDAADGYTRAGLATLATLLEAPYLSTDPAHQGLLLHAVYHRPNGWDHVPQGSNIPRGESCLWGDYHLREAAVYAGRLAAGRNLTFFSADNGDAA
jgi:unsaturated chondroitin disaccharide hydrolase